MTHDELVVRAEKWLKSACGCGVVFNDNFRAGTCTGEQPDGLGFRQGVSILVECKASRSDFLADKKKRFRKDPSLGIGDCRFFMCPPGVINIEDLPDGWGLLWVKGRQVKRVHGFPPNTQWYSGKPFTGNKEAEMDVMYSALRRVEVRGLLGCIYDNPFKRPDPEPEPEEKPWE